MNFGPPKLGRVYMPGKYVHVLRPGASLGLENSGTDAGKHEESEKTIRNAPKAFENYKITENPKFLKQKKSKNFQNPKFKNPTYRQESRYYNELAIRNTF